MTITLYTGLPRSGKTYRAVHDVVEKFFDYDPENSEYVRKPSSRDTFIATNIRGLSGSLPDVWDWERTLLEKKIKFQEFFTEEFQKELMSEGDIKNVSMSLMTVQSISAESPMIWKQLKIIWIYTGIWVTAYILLPSTAQR